ncbi:hypothetical protein BESB_077530 [Besnoitia besnoiti]|uniref:DEAD/DEAH box helicase domain-containing protein n=1 Tax=Besnoitia besnoiti TaxID=94643 RepID=A0A2A9MC83_BESBE|nr:hypothetical protein BESB_077530 [Besnoitia besnoiti]PFH33536.1 hypothetical protein BESB_077530 [Besnoitia besnoiti]
MHATRPGDPPADGSCDLEEGAGEAEEEEKAASAGDSGELEPEVSWRSMPHRPSLLPDGERPASAGASASAVSCLLSPDTSSERAPDAFDGADDEGPSVESPRTLLELLQETSHEGLLQALRPAGAPGTGISDGDPTDPAHEGTLQLPLLLSDEAAQTCLDRPHRPEARSADVQQKPGRGAEAAAEAQVRGDGDSLTFRDFRLAPQLLKSLDNLGFEIPSPVQCAAVPAALARRDLIVQAKSGTGKTVAFALSLLQRLVHEVAASRESARAAAAAPFCARVAHPRASAPVSPSQSPSSASAAPSATAAPAQSSPSEEESSGLAFGLVVTPTRELAVQVANEIFRLAWFLRAPRVRLACLFGGRPLAVCQEQLRERPHLLITTPGRLLSLLRSKATQKILAAWPCVCGARRKGRAPAHAARDTEALDAGNDHGDAGTETKPHGDAQAPSAEAKSDEGEQPLAWEKEDKKDDAFCRPCRRMAAARRLKQHLRVFVVDEADLLFDEFFRPQMQALLTSLLTRRMQVLAFSATFPPPLLCFFEELVETLDTKWLAAEGTRRRKKDEDSLRQRALAFVAAHAEAQRQGAGTPELARAYVGRVEVGAGRSGAGAHHAPPGKEAVATDAAAAHMKAVAQVGDGLAPATLREDPRPQISAASGGALPDPDAVPGESPALDGRGGRQTDERATAEFLSTAGGVPKERPAGRAAGAAASEPEAPPEEPRKFERILLCSSFILHDSKRKRETERRANASEQTARSRALAAAASSSSSSSVVSARAKRAAELARLYATAQPGAPRREAHECAPAAQDGEAQSGGKPGDATDSPETARAAAGDLRQTAPDREGSEEREDRRAAGRPAAGDDESPMDTAATPESGPEEGEQPLACAGGRGSEAADGALAHEGGKRLPRKGVSKGDEPKLAEGPTPATPAEGRQRAGAQATAKAAAEAEASADSHKEAGPVASVTASAPPLADVVPGSPDESVLTASQPPSTSFTAAASASARVASYSSSSVLSPHASSSTGSPPSQSPSSGAVDAAEPNDREERRKCQPASASLPSPLLAGIQYALLLVPDEPSPMRQLGAKVRVLLRVLSTLRFRQAIVFCNSFDSGAQVANCLNQLGVGAIYTSARLRQEDRVRALLALKRVECRVLVCSDVISRGVDAVGVDLTVNLDLPMDKQTFLHRSGRAGRFGGEGFCISIASEEEGPYWRYLAASFKIFLHSSLDALRRSGRRHAAAQPDASTGRGDSGYRERHDKTPSASCARQQRTGHTGARGSGEARDTSTCEKLDIRDGANEGFVRNCTPPDLAAGAPVSPGFWPWIVVADAGDRHSDYGKRTIFRRAPSLAFDCSPRVPGP